MPDEAPVVEQDQPNDAPEAPETDQPSGGEEEFSIDSFDPTQVPEDADREWFAERVKKLRADYTKKTQSLAEERREAEQARGIVQALADPNRAPEVLKFFGLEIADEEPEGGDLPPDPDERIDRMEAAFTQWQQEQQKAAEAIQAENELVAQIEELEDQAGREFTDKEVRLLSGQETDPKALHALLGEIEGERKQQWEEELRNGKSKTPRKPGSGTPASKAVDLSKLSGRELREAQDQLAAEAAEEAMASGG